MRNPEPSNRGFRAAAPGRPARFDDATLRLVVAERMVAVVCLTAGSVVFGAFDARVAPLVLVLGLGANLLFRSLARAGRSTTWVHVLDMGVCVLFPALDPATLLPAVLVMMAVVALAATMVGTVVAVGVTVLGVAGLTATGLTAGLPDAVVAVIAFGVAGSMVAFTVGRLAAAEARARRNLDDLGLDRAEAGRWVRCPRRGVFTQVNDRAVALLGWPRGSWLAPGFWERHVHPDDRERAEAALAQTAEDQGSHEIGYRFRTADGRWLHLHDRVTAVTDSTGRTVALQGVSLDVTGLVQIERQVDQYVDIMERIDLALLVLTLEGVDGRLRVVASNPAAEHLLGRNLSRLVGETVDRALPQLDRTIWARLTEVVRHERPVSIDDVDVRARGGARRVVTLRGFPLPDRAVGVSLQDVTDAVTASEALRRQALHDGLTGLPNRRMLDDRLQGATRRALADGGSVALLVMDLDQFKEVNDALGHHVGDQVLRGIGRRLGGLYGVDLVARLGGDEFAVLLQDATADDARRAAERIRSLLAKPFSVDAIRLQSNVSIGIALFPDQALDVPTLVQRADVAMYHAKATGTGVSVYAAEHDRSSVERLTLIGDLPSAVSSGQLTLHYQPVLDLRTGSVVRVEALVRWNHPRFGLLGPDQFVELAELSGVIQSLTRWVLREALGAARTWHLAGHDLGLAVNLSVRNLQDPELVDMFAAALDEHAVSPTDLVLELTETEIMDDPALARETFSALGRLGVRTAIDDFGTGYSSLTYLRDLPLHEIKIDRSFVQVMHRRGDEFAIVRSIIDLGHSLNIEVVAEGVEQEGDLEMLRQLGCDLAQGFYVGPPLPLPELLTLLATPPAPAGADVDLTIHAAPATASGPVADNAAPA